MKLNWNDKDEMIVSIKVTIKNVKNALTIKMDAT